MTINLDDATMFQDALVKCARLGLADAVAGRVDEARSEELLRRCRIGDYRALQLRALKAAYHAAYRTVVAVALGEGSR